MKTVGIVAEYNPFHAGHARHIRETRRLFQEETAVVAVMSGNWVQRGECAITDKWTRTGMALAGGVDLVLELPTVWAAASAEGFARGAMAVLEAAGVVEGWEKGRLLCSQRNKFQLGDTLEALLPGKPPVKIPVEDLRNGEGEPIQATPHATMAFSLPWEEPLPAGTILRFCSGKGIQP